MENIVNVSFNITKFVISFIVGLMGVCKLSSSLHPETYRILDNEFRYVYNPAWEKKLSTTIDPVQFKFAVGSIEVFAVVLLWISKSKKIRSVAGGILAIMMLGAAYTHILVGESPLFPSTIAAFCCIEMYTGK